MKTPFYFFILSAAISGFFPQGNVFAQAASCDNFVPVSYSITNNAGSSRFLAHTPINTNITLRTKSSSLSGESMDLVLVMDRSGSMGRTESPASSQTKLEAAKAAMNEIVDAIAAAGNFNNRIALVTFSDNVTLDQPLTNDYNALKVAIHKVTAGGFTSIGGGFFGAGNELKKNSTNPATRKFIILLSDGAQNRAPSTRIGIAAVPPETTVYTIGLGADADARSLQKFASTAGAGNGEYFLSGAENLGIAYRGLMKKIIGAFTLFHVSASLARDDVSSVGIANTVPKNDSYDSPNSVIHWKDLGTMVNGQEKTITVTFNAEKIGKNIPLNTYSFPVSYTISGKKCTEAIPINVLTVDIAEPVPAASSCKERTWLPPDDAVCAEQVFIQTSNCGSTRTSSGTKFCAQCSDGNDNDNDGFIDYPVDKGCPSSSGDSEVNRVIRFF